MIDQQLIEAMLAIAQEQAEDTDARKPDLSTSTYESRYRHWDIFRDAYVNCTPNETWVSIDGAVDLAAWVWAARKAADARSAQ